MEATSPPSSLLHATGAISSRDGTRIAYQSRGAGRPVVLVHGSLATSAGWRAVADLLALTHRVTTYDRRGHGESGDAAPYAFEREVEDLLAVLQEVGPGATLVGHSFGGALSACAAHDAHISALVLHEPGFRFTAPVDDRALASMDDALEAGDPDGVLVAGMRGVVGFTGDEVDAARSSAGWDDQVALASTWPRELRGLDAIDVTPQAFSRITVPTLLLRGTESPDWLRRSTEQAAHSIHGSRLAELPGQGHGAAETAPDLVANEITSFIDTFTPSTESTR